MAPLDEGGSVYGDHGDVSGSNGGGYPTSHVIAGVVVVVVGLVLVAGGYLYMLRQRERSRNERAQTGAPSGPSAAGASASALPRGNINASSYRRGRRTGLQAALARPIELARLGRSRRIVSPPPPYVPGIVLPDYAAEPVSSVAPTAPAPEDAAVHAPSQERAHGDTLFSSAVTPEQTDVDAPPHVRTDLEDPSGTSAPRASTSSREDDGRHIPPDRGTDVS